MLGTFWGFVRLSTRKEFNVQKAKFPRAEACGTAAGVGSGLAVEVGKWGGGMLPQAGGILLGA